MRLTIENGALYVNNHFTCYAGVQHGSPSLQPGKYAVTPQYSHAHGKDLPYAIGLGYIGADAECHIILGRVLAKHGCIPCPSSLAQVMAKIEVAEDDGKEITLEIKC